MKNSLQEPNGTIEIFVPFHLNLKMFKRMFECNFIISDVSWTGKYPLIPPTHEK